VAEVLTGPTRTPRQLAWRRFRSHRAAVISAFVLAVLTLVVFVPTLVTAYGPLERTGDGRLAGPSLAHWFGTDDLQRDLLSRVLHGGQISLQVGVATALASGLVGTVIGSLAGYWGRWVDEVLMRVTDLFLSIPLLVALIVLTRLPGRHPWAATVMGAEGSVRAIVTILSLFFWMPMARIVRGEVLAIKERPYIEAARAIGRSHRGILLRHVLPNALGPIVVNVTLSIAAAVQTESALSFLGFGVESATTPTWGNLLAGTKAYLRTSGHLVVFPGLAIVVTVLSVNHLGDGLRDALDPRTTQDRR
jgi:peptide/nickel transport system permease protein